MSPALYTVPSGFPFTDALVAGVLHRTKGDALALAEQTILLPTRRACRAVREAFLRAGKGRPLLLPRLLAVGDPDESDLILTAADSLELPPVLSGLRRQLLLARLVGAMRWEERTPSPDQAVRLAASLADFLDQTQSDGVSFDDFRQYGVSADWLRATGDAMACRLADAVEQQRAQQQEMA